MQQAQTDAGADLPSGGSMPPDDGFSWRHSRDLDRDGVEEVLLESTQCTGCGARQNNLK
jgi:hypothetical protein